MEPRAISVPVGIRLERAAGVPAASCGAESAIRPAWARGAMNDPVGAAVGAIAKLPACCPASGSAVPAA